MSPAAVRPVLALDVDGVLNYVGHPGSWRMLGWPGALDPRLVQKVAALVKRTDARVVLSSMWRKCEAGTRGTALAFEYCGWRDARLIVRDETPWLPGRPRGEEIQAWLRNADYTGPVAILDDESDMGALLPRLVQTDRNIGVTDKDLARAEALLRGA